MASLNVKTEYSEYKDCKLRVGKYVEDNSVAVEIYNEWSHRQVVTLAIGPSHLL